MPRFRDQDARSLTDNSHRLRQYDLYMTRVEADTPADLGCPRGRMHPLERHHPSFGFRDHLLGDDDNIADLERHAKAGEGVCNEVGQRGTVDDLGEAGNGIDRSRTQACGGVLAKARSATPSSCSRRRVAVSRGSCMKATTSSGRSRSYRRPSTSLTSKLRLARVASARGRLKLSSPKRSAV